MDVCTHSIWCAIEKTLNPKAIIALEWNIPARTSQKNGTIVSETLSKRDVVIVRAKSVKLET